MADPIPPATKRKIKLAYLDGGLSLAAAADKYGVSERLVYEWSRKENWVEAKAKRRGESPPHKPIRLTTFPAARGGPQAQPGDAGPLELPESLEDLRRTLDRAIAKLDQAIQSPHDGRNLAQQSASLGKLIELRARISEDTWLLNEMMARFPSPKALVQRLRELHYGSSADCPPAPNFAQAETWPQPTPKT